MRLFGLRPVSGLRGQRGLANASPEHRKHLHWTCTNQTKNVQPLAAVAVVFVNPGARWRLTNTINRQRLEAAVCCENIETTIGVAGDEDAAGFIVSAAAQQRVSQFNTTAAVGDVVSVV